MSSLHDKLYNYEVMPPGNTWDKIATALDEPGKKNNYPTRLYNMEVPPPPAVWQQVDASLSNQEVPAASTAVKLKPLFRYAAAAVLIGFIAYAAIRLTTGHDNNEPYRAVATSPMKDTETKAKANPVVPASPGNVVAALESETGKKRPVHEKVVRRHETAQRKSTSTPVNASFAHNIEYDPQLAQSIYAYADHVPDISDRYVMLLTPDGNIIRMAKKWSNLVCCVSGEEQDPNCKSQIKKWQEKIASSPIAPSPGNFMDILGLVNSLNDTNGL